MAKKKPPHREQKTISLLISESVVMRLVDPAQILPEHDDLDAATQNRIDEAACEIAEALVASGRSLVALHALRTAATERGFRRGYREGALSTGWLVHALTGNDAR